AYTRRPEYLDAFRKTAAYYLEKLPEDMIPYWDMIFTEGDEPRDSSSANTRQISSEKAGGDIDFAVFHILPVPSSLSAK
ncbi:MAG: hypothetical protein IKJ45_17510, partial [Kiritimatiellae bacterium]|nr:hypothetical protein [Kiritimatiellia bacterium]